MNTPIELTAPRDATVLAGRLRAYMDKHELSQRRVAKLTGITQGQVSRILGGRIETVHNQTAERMERLMASTPPTVKTMADLTSRLCEATADGLLEWEPGESDDQWLVDQSGKRFVLTRDELHGVRLTVHDVESLFTPGGIKVPLSSFVSKPLAVADQRHDASGLDYLWRLATSPVSEVVAAFDALDALTDSMRWCPACGKQHPLPDCDDPRDGGE